MKNKKIIISLLSVIAVVVLTTSSLEFMRGSVVNAQQAGMTPSMSTGNSNLICNPDSLIDLIMTGQLDSFGHYVSESEVTFDLTSENKDYLEKVYGLLVGLDPANCSFQSLKKQIKNN